MQAGERLALAAAAGDAAAFGVLVRQHQSQLRGFLRRLTRGDYALADDLAQETFLEAHRKIDQFRGVGSFGGWLYAIAWSRFRMAARKRKLEPLDEDALDDQVTLPASDLKLDLERAFSHLSAAERAAVTLHFALGQSHEEIAAALGLPLGTAKSHILRGREKLKRLLDAP